MVDREDLIQRAAGLKQSLLLALRHANAAVLDGSRTEADIVDLAAARDLARDARDQVELLLRRLEFQRELDLLRGTARSEDVSRRMISLVRIGIEGGYQIEDVRRLIDEAQSRP